MLQIFGEQHGRRRRPCPSACRDGRDWRPGPRPSTARGWRWRAVSVRRPCGLLLERRSGGDARRARASFARAGRYRRSAVLPACCRSDGAVAPHAITCRDRPAMPNPRAIGAEPDDRIERGARADRDSRGRRAADATARSAPAATHKLRGARSSRRDRLARRADRRSTAERRRRRATDGQYRHRDRRPPLQRRLPRRRGRASPLGRRDGRPQRARPRSALGGLTETRQLLFAALLTRRRASRTSRAGAGIPDRLDAPPPRPGRLAEALERLGRRGWNALADTLEADGANA